MHARRQFPDLVQKQGAVLSHGDFALARRRSAGEGPLLVTEHFAFQQGFHECAAIDRDERPFGFRACAVNGAGDEFLAGTGFAADQHRHTALRHHADSLVGLLHGAAAAREGTGGRGAVDHQFIVAPASLIRPGRQRAIDRRFQFVDIDGFRDIIDGAGMHRGDRRIEVMEGGNHDDG